MFQWRKRVRLGYCLKIRGSLCILNITSVAQFKKNSTSRFHGNTNSNREKQWDCWFHFGKVIKHFGPVRVGVHMWGCPPPLRPRLVKKLSILLFKVFGILRKSWAGTKLDKILGFPLGHTPCAPMPGGLSHEPRAPPDRSPLIFKFLINDAIFILKNRK